VKLGELKLSALIGRGYARLAKSRLDGVQNLAVIADSAAADPEEKYLQKPTAVVHSTHRPRVGI
jgi:hypothetical protein